MPGGASPLRPEEGRSLEGPRDGACAGQARRAGHPGNTPVQHLLGTDRSLTQLSDTGQGTTRPAPAPGVLLWDWAPGLTAVTCSVARPLSPYWLLSLPMSLLHVSCDGRTRQPRGLERLTVARQPERSLSRPSPDVYNLQEAESVTKPSRASCVLTFPPKSASS